ncbi:MAG: hypothetical protein JW741_29985 [Sedimentisphaerales bacterium]|nr:hypothetical protein [Sedimentisphaerales bacterium]
MGTNEREDLAGDICETARRLRLIQVDFASEDQQTRMEYLHEEMARVLKTVLPEHRKAFLEGLMERFPAEHPTTTPAAASPASGPAPQEPRDAEKIVSSLVEMAASLPADRKQALAARMQEAGFELPAATGPQGSGEAAETLRARLELDEGTRIDREQVAVLAGMLADFALKLEPLIWNTWRTLSPRSSIRPPRGLRKRLGESLSGEAPGQNQRIELELQMLQKLIAATITAVGGVGRQFAKNYLARYAPREIEAAVALEGTSFFGKSRDGKCWEKYKELAETLTEDSMEAELRKAIADYAESLLKGLHR